MAQLGEHLPSMHNVLGSIINWAHACHPRTGQQRQEGQDFKVSFKSTGSLRSQAKMTPPPETTDLRLGATGEPHQVGTYSLCCRAPTCLPTALVRSGLCHVLMPSHSEARRPLVVPTAPVASKGMAGPRHEVARASPVAYVEEIQGNRSGNGYRLSES